MNDKVYAGLWGGLIIFIAVILIGCDHKQGLDESGQDLSLRSPSPYPMHPHALPPEHMRPRLRVKYTEI